jgi:hypothetical protein
LQQLELKIIKNLLIWSIKKCSLLNSPPKILKEPHQLIWEVKSETLLKEALSTLLSLSKEPTTEIPFHYSLPKKFWVTAEEPEESKETFFLKMLSSTEPKPLMPLMKTMEFSG